MQATHKKNEYLARQKKEQVQYTHPNLGFICPRLDENTCDEPYCSHTNPHFHFHFKKRAEAVIEAARKEIAYKNEGQVCVMGRLRAGVLKPSTGQLSGSTGGTYR